uniref:hypothetical protein n=1 Tax=Mobilicoccus massiliensis TaxID=1522310 RepID=UPI0011443B07
MTAAIRALSVVGVVFAFVVVLVLGVPALLGWVPLPVDDDASGVPAGSLVVLAPTSGAAGDRPNLTSGDAVALTTDSGRLVVRTITAATPEALDVSAVGGGTARVPTDHLRAVERYRIPAAGHLVAAVPPDARPLWGRILGGLLLVWAAAEVWDGLRGGPRRGQHA